MVPEYPLAEELKSPLAAEEEQNMHLHNMPLWHKDYFKLKAFKTQQTQEKFLPTLQLPKIN